MVSSLIEYGADCLGGGAEHERQMFYISMHILSKDMNIAIPFTALTYKAQMA